MKVVYNRYIDLCGLKYGFRDLKNIEITVPGKENCSPLSLFSASFVLTCAEESHRFISEGRSEVVFEDVNTPFITDTFACYDGNVSEGFPREIKVRCELLPWCTADRYVSSLDADGFLWFCKRHGIGPDPDDGDLCEDDLLKACEEAWSDLDNCDKGDIIWDQFNYDAGSFDCDDDYSDELEIVEMTAEE